MNKLYYLNPTPRIKLKNAIPKNIIQKKILSTFLGSLQKAHKVRYPHFTLQCSQGFMS